MKIFNLFSRIALKAVVESAHAGDARNQTLLGDHYRAGKGLPKNEIEAVKWYRKAADQGHAIAEFNLALCYEQGIGIPRNSEEAFRWYKLAAVHGNIEAQNSTGYCYEYGEGVSQDYGEALKWYRESASRGDQNAQFNIGNMYRLGKGVLKNPEEAAKWFRMSAAQGNSDAANNLRVCRYMIVAGERVQYLVDARDQLIAEGRVVDPLAVADKILDRIIMEGPLDDQFARALAGTVGGAEGFRSLMNPAQLATLEKCGISYEGIAYFMELEIFKNLDSYIPFYWTYCKRVDELVEAAGLPAQSRDVKVAIFQALRIDVPPYERYL